MCQTMPSTPVLALVMPAVSGCMAHELLRCRRLPRTLDHSTTNEARQKRCFRAKDAAFSNSVNVVASRRNVVAALAARSTDSLHRRRASNLDWRSRPSEPGCRCARIVTGGGHEETGPARRCGDEPGSDGSAGAG